MDDKAPIAEKGAYALSCRGELVIVRDHEGIRRDLAMLAAQVANLAGLGEPGVAGRVFAADERIQVSEGLGAVAVARNRFGMDVIGCRTSISPCYDFSR